MASLIFDGRVALRTAGADCGVGRVLLLLAAAAAAAHVLLIPSPSLPPSFPHSCRAAFPHLFHSFLARLALGLASMRPPRGLAPFLPLPVL